MPDLHLVDATYELFRAYHAPGVPGRANPDGREVGAVRGLCSSLLSLLREDGVTHIACATDTVIRSFRNELFDGYKTEVGVERDLLDQFGPAEDAMRALGIVVWAMEEFEADDALATAAARYASEFDRVVICTPDKDMAQCVIEDRVILLDRMRKKTYDAAAVVEKWGVPPASIPDYLALVGDTADGIPGLPGWGAKSSATVLSEYGTLDAIPDDAAEWSVKVRGAQKLATTLAGRREDALLYRTLATLRIDVPLAETAADLEWRGATAEWKSHAQGQGFDRLADRPHRWRA